MPPEITTFYITQGVLGISCVVLAFVTWKFYNRIQQLQDTRFSDYKEIIDKVTKALEANTNATNVLAAKIEAGKRNGGTE